MLTVPPCLRRPLPSLFCCPGLLLMLLVAAQPATAADTLQEEMEAMAEDIGAFLKGFGKTDIAVLQFVCNQPTLAPSGGQELRRVLIDQLKAEEVNVLPIADFGISGEFQPATDRSTGHAVVHLRTKIVDSKGNQKVAFDRAIFGEGAFARVFGPTKSLPPEADAKRRSEILADSVETELRQTHIEGTQVAADKQSPYVLEILVQANPDSESIDPKKFKARNPTNVQGLAFVPIERNEIYAVRLINNSPHDAAVELSIDGLNMFTFSENKTYRHVIVPAGKSGLMTGWHRTNELSDSFLITEYAKTPAAELLPADASSLGTITATFSAAWPEDAELPPDEPAAANQFSRSADATGRGPKIDSKYEEVLRHVGVIRATVSVRYLKQ